MESKPRRGRVLAIIGAKESLHATLSAEFAGEPGSMVLPENAPVYPDLSIQNNAQQLRMLLPKEALADYEALLKRSNLKKQGWTQPFRRDMVGQKRLFGLLAAMLTRPETLLAYDLLAGMEARQREAFAAMADCYREQGGTLVYTAKRLRDVLRLELAQEIRLPGADGFVKTDAEALHAKCAEAGSPEQAEALLERLEAGEAW